MLWSSVLVLKFFWFVRWKVPVFKQYKLDMGFIVGADSLGTICRPIIFNGIKNSINRLIMNYGKCRALSTTTKNPKSWLRYVDDTLVIRSHWEEHNTPKLCSQHNSIYHWNRKEREVGISICADSLSHKVYLKPTHTDSYLNRLSKHQPRQKMGL